MDSIKNLKAFYLYVVVVITEQGATKYIIRSCCSVLVSFVKSSSPINCLDCHHLSSFHPTVIFFNYFQLSPFLRDGGVVCCMALVVS
jgi:hypothetical protein